MSAPLQLGPIRVLKGRTACRTAQLDVGTSARVGTARRLALRALPPRKSTRSNEGLLRVRREDTASVIVGNQTGRKIAAAPESDAPHRDEAQPSKWKIFFGSLLAAVLVWSGLLAPGALAVPDLSDSQTGPSRSPWPSAASASTKAHQVAPQEAAPFRGALVPAFLPDFRRPATTLAPPDVKESDVADELTAEERRSVAIFESNTPTVVNIANIATMRTSRYSMNLAEMPRGSGSGFIWDEEGHVVTNYHVVKGASSLRVTLYDSSTCPATVVGFDENKDIAVLKLELPASKAQALKTVDVGRSTSLKVGQKVYAIGNPFGLDHTLTQGIVSGLQREIQANPYGPKIKGVIQTDAAINPGNSGGVLLDSSGRLIGVNSAILDPSQSGSFSGVGFAIPIDSVRGLVSQLLMYGQVVRPVLGVQLAPPQILSRFGIDGVLVYAVPDGTPAAKAGLRSCARDSITGDLILGDIIVAIDGKSVTDSADLFDALDAKKPGDQVALDLLRPAGSRELKSARAVVTLGDRSTAVAEG